MPKTPRTDDLLQSHPGEPYTYLTPLARVEEKDLQGSIPVGSVSLADLIIGADGTFIKTVGAAAVWTLITAADITSGNLAYARLPTGGGTWANGGALSITGGITTVAGLSSTANVAVSTAGGSDGLSLSRPVATPGGINFATSGSNRWGIYVTEAAESGSDAGSNFRIRARTDAGAFLDDPITVVRAAGGAIALGSAGGRSVVVGVDPGGSELVRIGGAVRAGDVVKTTGSNAAFIADNRNTPGTNAWFLYNQDGTSLRFYRGADYMVLSTTALNPSAAGGLTLGASAARWGKLWGQDADFSLDVKMDVLGTFDHTGTRFSTGAGPVADDIMSWHGSAGKWRPRFLQTQFTSGAAVSQNNTDGTFATFFNSNPSLSGAPSNPSVAPVVTAMYKSTLIDMSAYVLGGTQVYVLDYSVNGGGYTTDRIITTSAKVIHSSLDPTKTYAYKYKIRGGSDSSYSPASSAINPSTATEANAFGLIVASQIATAYLSSINANIGSITAGQLISGDGKSLLQLDSSFSVPGAVTQGIFFASANPVPGTVTGMYIDFTATTTNPLLHHSKFDLLADGSAILKGVVRDTDSKFVIDVAGTTARLITIIDEQGSPKTRVKIGEVNTGASDWGLQVFDSAGATIVDMTAANLLIQDSAVKFKADFTNALITVTDAQGSPIVRSKFGKISGATDDYGLQVWDKLGDTVIDFTGAKRILAVPVQPSADSGTAITVDLSTGLTQQVRLTGTATVTFTNPTNGGRYRIWFQQDTTGSRPFPTIVGPNGEVVMYTNDTPPTLTTTPGALDLFEFEYRTNPTTRFTCMTLQTNVLLPTPQVQSMTPTSVSSASTTHNVSMPATVNAGDLLLMLITFHATQGSVTTPSGWTAAGSIGLANIFTKAASGSEGGTTVNVVTANSVKAAAQTYRITRWFGNAGTNGVVVATNSGAPGTSADPSNNTPNWTDRTLWLAAAAVTGNPTFSVDPTNYTNVQSTGDGASTCLLRSLRRTLYATSENPSTFTWSGSQSWSAFTIAVRPPA